MQTLGRCNLLVTGSNDESLSVDKPTAATAASTAMKPPPKKKSALLTYKRSTVITGSAKTSSPEEILVKYITAINLENFDPDQHPHLYTSEEYSAIRPLISRLFCIPATSAPVERVFSQGGIIMRPHRAKMSDDLLEMVMYLRCNGN